MEKIVKYIETHPLVRIIIVISAIIGLAVAFPTIISWFGKAESKTKQEKPQTHEATSFKEYFIPTHKVTEKGNTIIPIRNRPLTSDEAKESILQTKQGKVIDANTIVGQLNCCSSIKILTNENTSLKIQYWDGTETIIGYIPDSTNLELIKPVNNNPYGLSNGLISVYTTNETVIEKIFLDDELVGSINYYFESEPNCEDSTGGVLKIVAKAGEHVVKGVDVYESTWIAHVTLYQGKCYLLNLSD